MVLLRRTVTVGRIESKVGFLLPQELARRRVQGVQAALTVQRDHDVCMSDEGREAAAGWRVLPQHVRILRQLQVTDASCIELCLTAFLPPVFFLGQSFALCESGRSSCHEEDGRQDDPANELDRKLSIKHAHRIVDASPDLLRDAGRAAQNLAPHDDDAAVGW